MPRRNRRESENADLFRELFDRVPIGLYRTTPGGKVVDVNPALVEMLGYPDRETLLAEAAEAVYAQREARDRWRAEMAAKGTVSGFETEWRRRDGILIWVEESAHAVRDADGSILHYEGSAQDVTVRRRAQAQLAEEKARFEQLFAAAPEAIVLCDEQAIVQRVNDEFTQLFGYAESEASGRRIDELVAGGIPELAEEASRVTRDIASGKTTYVESRRRRKDGGLVHVSVLGKPVFTGTKQVAHYAIYRDITARVEMETRLAEEKARFEQLFASAPEAIVLCTNSGSVLRANDAFFDLFGYSSDEVVGRDIDHLVAPERDGLQAEAKGITQQIAEGQMSFVETQRRRKDGRLVHVSILGKPVLIDGDQIAIYGIYRDITAQKRAEAALALSHRKVERLHEAADALAGAAKEEDIYRITCEAAERVLGFSLGILCIAEGDEFACQAVSSTIEIESLGRTRIDPAGIAIRALESGQPIIVNDPKPENLPHGIPATSRSLICAPIGALGIFQAASPEPGAFSTEDGRLLAILLGHTAVGVSRLRLQGELIEQARHDALTGAFNRRYFNEFIAQEVLRASRYKHPIGLLMIDVNRFKEINDRYGHQTGDMVLREIAAVLMHTVRNTDMVVRYGGDEFLVVLTETGQEAEEAAIRVRSAVKGSAKLREISGFAVTVSVGSIFWHPDAGTPIEEALATADARMYDDKRAR
ncbi:MAG: PAS domain S-box protein [Candidatus Bipolaricaulota bacterium]|nr:PAS domain S-box protein [Candidatus Bipolaricaulota bacterium]